MKNEKRSWFKLVFFGLVVLLASARFTDADFLDREDLADNIFEATTLDFANRDTANLTEKSLFFNIFGLQPTGFAVESVRIKKEGNLGFTYQVVVEQTLGNPALCQALQLRVMRNWQLVYEGSVMAFNYSGALIEENEWHDLVMSLGLPDDAPSDLANQNCGFNIYITTMSGEQGSPFTDQEVLTSQIQTGGWL